MKNDRWDKIYIRMALELAKGSKDSKMKVGCVVTSKDRKMILTSGVNGGTPGGRNKRLSNKRGKSGFIHAEMNALLYKHNYNPYYGMDYCPVFKAKYFKAQVLYCSHLCCTECAFHIISCGCIKEVYYHKEYKSNAKTIFKNAGIKCHQIKLSKLPIK